MPFRLKISILIVALMIVLLAVVPLFVAPGEPPGARPLAEVAGPDAEYVTVEGIDLHVVRSPPAAPNGGGGSDPLFVLLHGFPFSTASFDALAPLLAVEGEVVAVDLPGFGLSERPLGDDLRAGLDPYSATGQVRLVRGLLGELRRGETTSSEPVEAAGEREVYLIGHDSGARLALDVALDLAKGSAGDLAPGAGPGAERAAEPTPEIAGLVLIGASPYTSNRRSWLARTAMNSPQLERLGPVFLRQIAQEPGVRILRAGWHDPTAIEQEHLDSYQRPWTVEGWDDALWQLTKADAPPSLEGALGVIDVPALVVAGEEDAVVPVGESERLAAELPNARLELVAGCGHAVPAECPGELARTIETWLASLP